MLRSIKNGGPGDGECSASALSGIADSKYSYIAHCAKCNESDQTDFTFGAAKNDSNA